MYPEDLKYTKRHEWVRKEGNRATIGITSHAQDQLGAVVGLGLPATGIQVSAGDTLADIDSMKTADIVYAPVSGKVVETNKKLENHPELVNDDPYGEGWIAVIEMSNEDELNSLMSATEYEVFVKRGES
ncbi:MAG TPA: glycine cleavage system protein GcvH [Firmicutes bacterium]|nr:glycine cleavage system protein GcvH [Bacillota bacterium]HHY97166.1 glycine cleavage system protein GcvH [Bacillota bacterium]